MCPKILKKKNKKKPSQMICKVFMFLFNFFINCKLLCWTRGRKKLFFLNLFINIRFK